MGSSVINSVKIQDCFVGEACQLSNGFTASASVFFANSYMSNGEACAAFCGPFTASHHKSSLLIGGMFSFYNAGSATNFSNHAYKMGPMHWGILERGSKTASGAYLLMPATLGSFSVCFGKLMHHPNTRNLPFAYLIAAGAKMFSIAIGGGTTAIDSLNTIADDNATYYDLQGNRLNAPQKGINIVKRGSKTMKVIIK